MHKIKKRTEPKYFTDWKEDFQRRNGKEPSYSDLPREEYQRLKKDLVEEQGYICCYCEKAIGKDVLLRDCNIEHFMPRNPDRSFLSYRECVKCQKAQMDYDNMFASCLGEESNSLDHCNHKKENWYDARYCISPISDAVETLFGFRVDGRIIAIDNNMCAQVMKEHLNLNTYMLCEQRKKAYDTVLEVEFEEEELIKDDSYLADTIAYYKKMDASGKYTPFCSMITYCLQNYFF